MRSEVRVGVAVLMVCGVVVAVPLMIMIVTLIILIVTVMIVFVAVVTAVATMIAVVMIRWNTIHFSAVLEHAKLGGRDAAAQDALGRNLAAGQIQAPQCGRQILQRKAGVEQGAEHHVARDSRKTVEVQQSGHYS